MQCYTELTAPTAVTHAVSLPLLGPKANNLIVAKTSLLQIFELKSITTDAGGQTDEGDGTIPNDGDFLDGGLTLQRTETTTKLVLITEYTLSGTVTGLEGIKILDSKSGGKALLVSLKDAKLSLLEWDPEEHCLHTISSHLYEGEALRVTPWALNAGEYCNRLIVDPDNRCAALRINARQLAILPMRQEDLGGDDYDEFDQDGEAPGDGKLEAAVNGSIPNGEPVTTIAQETEGSGPAKPTPYHASKVVPLTRLDPSLVCPVHMTFLHGYREATFGIISSSKSTSHALGETRKDVTVYSVFTVDLEGDSYAPILSVSGLPTSLWQVVPLSLPVGGALLVGADVLVHIDQTGKTNAVAVNSFAKHESSLAMSDQSQLGLKLEGSAIHQIGAENGDSLLITEAGELAVVLLKRDGQSVSGLEVHKISSDKGGSTIRARASCIAGLGRNRVFVGSEEGDSLVLGWTRRIGPTMSRKRSYADMLGDDAGSEGEEENGSEDEDDLYADVGPATKKRATAAAVAPFPPESYSFRHHDSLQNLGMTRNISIAKDIIATSTGHERSGGIALISQCIKPLVAQQQQIKSAQAIWSVYVREKVPEELAALGHGAEQGALVSDLAYDQYMIASVLKEDEVEASALYRIIPSGIEEMQKGEFERDSGPTIEAGTVAAGTRVVQVLRGDVRSYDSEFGLDQIILMEDEEAGTDPKNIAASFCDPYILLIRDDASILVLQADSSGSLDELETSPATKTPKWLSGCLYRSAATCETTLLFLLDAQGSISIFDVADLTQPVWTTQGAGLLGPLITQGFVPRRNAVAESIVELLVADVGDSVSTVPILVLRTSNDDLALYTAFHFPDKHHASFTTNLRWRRVPHSYQAAYSSGVQLQPKRQSTLRAVRNLDGRHVVFQLSDPSCFVIADATSTPKIINLDTHVLRSLTSLNTSHCEAGLGFVTTDGQLQIAQMPANIKVESGWPTRKIELGEQVDALSYFAPKDVYAVATSVKQPFKLPEDDYHHEWGREDLSLYPDTDQGILKLYQPKDWSVIDMFALEASEVVLTMKVLDLVVSEVTDKRTPLLVVGTGIMRGEDLTTNGRIYIFDVISVVPQPGRPETGFKLHLIVSEEVKGAVSAVSEIGTQGFLFAAQGQKGMVRGLKEDNTLLPVAFLDMNDYIIVAKSLRNSGLGLLGDLTKGLWFIGYTEDPYAVKLFGKTKTKMEIATADFLPFEQQLFITAIDGEGDLFVYQYDPENPTSLSGQRLLLRSTFHTGQMASTSTLIPAVPKVQQEEKVDGTAVTNGAAPILHPQQILITTMSGSLALLTSLDEQAYRRLSILQEHFQGLPNSMCGLNAFDYRNVASEGFATRGLLDGSLVMRGWASLSARGRSEAVGKVGVESWVVKADLESAGAITAL